MHEGLFLVYRGEERLEPRKSWHFHMLDHARGDGE